MPWPQTGAIQYHAQLGLPDKGHAIKGLAVCNDWDLVPLDLLNGMTLGSYQPSPEVLLNLKSLKSNNFFKLCNILFFAIQQYAIVSEGTYIKTQSYLLYQSLLNRIKS